MKQALAKQQKTSGFWEHQRSRPSGASSSLDPPTMDDLDVEPLPHVPPPHFGPGTFSRSASVAHAGDLEALNRWSRGGGWTARSEGARCPPMRKSTESCGGREQRGQLGSKHSKSGKQQQQQQQQEQEQEQNEAQTKTAAPLRDILFLCLYKGWKQNLQPRRCYFDPPPENNQPTCTFTSHKTLSEKNANKTGTALFIQTPPEPKHGPVSGGNLLLIDSLALRLSLSLSDSLSSFISLPPSPSLTSSQDATWPQWPNSVSSTVGVPHSEVRLVGWGCSQFS